MINWIAKYKQAVAYIVLVAFVIFAFASQEHNNHIQTARLKENTQKQTAQLKADIQNVLVKSCVRGNGVRQDIISVVYSTIPPVRAQEKKHIITKKVAQQELKRIHQVAVKFAPVHCKAVSNLNQKKK